VRELQNTIERAIILTEPGRMVSAAAMGLPSQGGTHLGDALAAIAESESLKELHGSETPNGVEEPLEGPGSGSGSVLNIAELEKQAIKSALEKTGGNRTKAAELLGISIRTLRNKLQEYRGSDDLVGVESGTAD
jgi:DNA-binding NtrC family response regulator